jgi:DnaJ domain
MNGLTAALAIGIGLLFTLSVGMAVQLFGRGKRSSAKPQQFTSTRRVTSEEQEDLDAVNEAVEAARSELMLLRNQVAKERARLDQLKRQAQSQGNGQQRQQPHVNFGPGPRSTQAPTQPSVDSPWVILGLRPGSSNDDIRRRYRLLSRVWHPDRFTGGPPELRAEAEVMMARLNRAYNAMCGQNAGIKPAAARPDVTQR